METMSLNIEGMSCNGCATNVEKLIQDVAGVVECNVNFGLKQAIVKYNSNTTNAVTSQKAITNAGYAASPTL